MTRKAIEMVTASCDPCRKMRTAPLYFRISFRAADVRFNDRIIFGIMYLDGDSVLHIVGEGTPFSVAKFLPDTSAMTLREIIINSWATIYTRMPHCILVDQGSSFGEGFSGHCRIGGVEVQRTEIEAHSSLNLCERYLQPLRTVY